MNNKHTLSKPGIKAEQRCIESGNIYEMHWHDYIELEIILNGKAEHIYNSEKYELGKGDAYIITHHDLHALRAVSNVILINISFDIEVLDDDIAHSLLYSAGKQLRYAFSDEEELYICGLCQKLILEQNCPKEHYEAMCKSVISQLVIELIRNSRTQKSSPSIAQRAVEYIHLHFRENILISNVADALSVTPNYLGRVFTRDMGMNFNDYLNQIRMRAVCNMLIYSSLPIKYIATMSGYSSIEYFFYLFKKTFSMTPTQYRIANI